MCVDTTRPGAPTAGDSGATRGVSEVGVVGTGSSVSPGSTGSSEIVVDSTENEEESCDVTENRSQLRVSHAETSVSNAITTCSMVTSVAALRVESSGTMVTSSVPATRTVFAKTQAVPAVTAVTNTGMSGHICYYVFCLTLLNDIN